MTSTGEPGLLFVNYHYIRDPEAYEHPGIHPLAPAAFSKQVEWLRQNFHVASPGEVEGLVLEGRPLPGPSVFLTFDDGLCDHWEAACEVLDPLGIKGAFFACSRPALEGRAIMVHKVHWLRAHTDPELFGEEFFSHIPEDARPAEDETRLRTAEKTYIYDTPKVARLKYALNFLLASELVDEATSAMFSARGIDEREFCKQTYMSDEQLRQLRERGHIVGVHGHSHTPFSKLGGRLIEDAGMNAGYLEEASGLRPIWVAYPYGREDALPDDRQISALREQLGLQIGLTMLGTWNDGSQNPMRLNRINTNEVEEVVAKA